MDVMNLIHDICLTKNSINNIPKWRFIKRNKQMRRFNKIISDFLNLDIFVASEGTISFLLGLNINTINNINVHGVECMDILIEDNTYISVTYYPITNRFEITSADISYTIYRNNKISNRINNIWEPLTRKIKEKYLEVIIQIAEYLSDIGGENINERY